MAVRSNYSDVVADARPFPFSATGGVLAAILVLAAVTVWLCGGHLIYSLDDPYITLGLGWHIGHGHYGLNASEVASPSSSIIYPFILSLFAWSPLQEWVPFFINSMAAACTAALFATLCTRYSIGSLARERLRTAFLVAVLCLSINIVGLVFTGLEHSLHTLTSVAVLYGLARTLEEGKVPAWLVPALVFNPLLRFEGAALTGLVLVALALSGHFRTALVGFVLTGAVLGGYTAFMSALGLPFLPSSVLVKTADDLGHLHHAIVGIWNYGPRALPLWVLLALVILHPFVRSRDTQRSMSRKHEWLFVAVVVGTVAAHATFGGWGWWYRYEIYAVATTAAAAIVLWHTEIRSYVHRANTRAVVIVALAMMGISAFYMRGTLMTPFAGRSIYEQQFQMHRFAVDFYRQPVAVNDLGWVSYRNPQYVLDLWGLGSEEARKARLITHPPGWLDDLTRAHHVGLAMIYTKWFAGDIPANWRVVGELRSFHTHVTAAQDDVTVYATSPANVPDARAALQRFAASSPADVIKVTLAPATN